MKHIAYIGLGSNIEDRFLYIEQAISLLNQQVDIKVEQVSSVYETAPVGYIEQPHFLNVVIKISTNLQPSKLLQITQEIENRLGRKREIHWGPRTIDLDILLYNHENIETEHLVVPHPRMFERAFVLAPLAEVNPEIAKQLSYIQVEEMKRREGVTLWKPRNGEGAFVLSGN